MSTAYHSFVALRRGRFTIAGRPLRSVGPVAGSETGHDLGLEWRSDDLERLNQREAAFNDEGDDSAAYQAHWDIGQCLTVARIPAKAKADVLGE